MSQTALGKAVDITFPANPKNTRTADSSSRLQQFSNLLAIPASFFFDGLQDGAMGNS
jgi:hypothetical protein